MTVTTENRDVSAGLTLILSAAMFLFGCPLAQAEAPKPGTAPAKKAAQIEWYRGRRFVWRNVFTLERYEALTKKLPAGQQAQLTSAHRFDLFPIDVQDGEDQPQISYVYSVAGNIKSYLKISSLEHLDLYARGEKEILADVAAFNGSMLTLPKENLDDAAVAGILGDKTALPNLVHVDIYAEKGSLTPKVLASLKFRHNLKSIQLSGPGVDDQWISALAHVDSIRAIRLFRTSVSATGLAALNQKNNLTHLSIESSDPPTDDAIKALAACSSLREIHLADAWTKDALIQKLANLPHLERLVLDEVKASPNGMKVLEKFKHLKVVVIWTNDPEMLAAVRAWQRADRANRELYTSPDPTFTGWISDFPVFWMNPREVDPVNFP